MELKILFSEDPAFALNRADAFLSSQPVLHNLILSILSARVAHPDPGRYWMVIERDAVVGVAIQSPLTFPATLTPMAPHVAAAMADAIAKAAVHLPGVNGEAATAATFAGQWSERTKSAATPFQGNRIYEYFHTGKVPAVQGKLRQAGPQDRNLMLLWTRAFEAEIGEPSTQTEPRMDRWLAAGEIWLWDKNGEATSMAVGREPTQGVVRIAGVYTPPENRNRGYAAACVHALSEHLRISGHRCILYTDLANPTSNSIYRRIGYRATAEALRYRFE
jgi:uncharacterized protein